MSFVRYTPQLETIAPDMDVRRIYTASAKVRRTLNHEPQTDPTRADAVLP